MKRLRGYKLCKDCGCPMLKKGQRRKHPDDYRHARGCRYAGLQRKWVGRMTARIVLTTREREALEAAAHGMVSGSLEEWPVLVQAFNALGWRNLPLTIGKEAMQHLASCALDLLAEDANK